MAHQPKYKVGDVVQLKSGGPKMTVTSVPSTASDYYHTCWFGGSKREFANFPEDALMTPADDTRK